MINIISSIILLVILMYSPTLYRKYIQFREDEIDDIRENIYKHYRDLYVY